MTIKLNHTIVSARDKRASAAFLAEILGLPAPVPFGPFLGVQADNDVTLDFVDATGSITAQHYAFLISEAEFDGILAGSWNARSPIGPIRCSTSRTGSAPAMAAAASISRIRTAICSKFSPVRTAAAADPLQAG